MPKFSAHLSMMFNEVGLPGRFQAAADAGFKAVEYFSAEGRSDAELKERLEEAGLIQTLFSFSCENSGDAGRAVAALPSRETEFREGVERALETARVLGCPQLNVLAGALPDGVSRMRCVETYVENLHYAAGALAEHGMRLLVEPINTRDFPGYLVATTREALEVIERIDADNVFLLYDIYQARIMGEDLAETFRANLDRICHVQIAGVPGRHEPDVGEIDYPDLFDLMDRLGYGGWVGCEYRPRAGTLEGLGWARPYGIG
jgi:hydroxypyruvate isomerase